MPDTTRELSELSNYNQNSIAIDLQKIKVKPASKKNKVRFT